MTATHEPVPQQVWRALYLSRAEIGRDEWDIADIMAVVRPYLRSNDRVQQ